MGRVDDRLIELGLDLPPAFTAPPDIVLPFAVVNVRGNRALVAGHGPQAQDGSIAPPFGQVGGSLSLDDGVTAAHLTALSMLGSLQRSLGSLDEITGWLRVFGMVNSAPGFHQQPAVVNGFSNVILDVFGPEVGRHARSAVGMAALPFGMPVEVEAEVAIR